MTSRFMDNNKSHYVSICLLDTGMPPFHRDAELIASYVEQLSDIPEDELREVIWSGLAIWFSWPSVDDIREYWQSGAYKTPR